MPFVVHPDGQIQINGRWLTIGSEVSVTGLRGRYKYTGFNNSGDGKLILHFLGGPSGHELMRSFYPDRIRMVHNRKPERPKR